MDLDMELQRKTQMELAKLLGLDPTKVTNINAEFSGGSLVMVRWEGVTHMKVEEFKDKLNMAYKAAGASVEVR
jgi:hypothetical protein